MPGQAVNADWAGVHAIRVLGADAATGSLVYAVFFATMTGVRFLGDALRSRLGATRTMMLAGGVASLGFGLVLLAGVLNAPIGTRVGSDIAGWSPAGPWQVRAWRWSGPSLSAELQCFREPSEHCPR